MGCEDCLDYCQFEALELADALLMNVDRLRCVGCGVCVPACPEDAMSLVRRPEEEIIPPPVTEQDWLKERAESRGIDISTVM
jgi:ferredoxin